MKTDNHFLLFMNKYALLLLSIGVVMLSCNRQNLDDQSALVNRLMYDPDIREIEHLRDSLLVIALENNISGKAIQEALNSGNKEMALSFYGMTQDEFEPIARRFNNAATRIQAKFPDLTEQVNSQEHCATCMAEKSEIFSNFDEFAKKQLEISANRMKGTQAAPPDPLDGYDPGGYGCAPAYYACLLLCVPLGPQLYPFCAIICVCEFCEGWVVDLLCNPQPQGGGGGGI